jgi:Mg-chelatase subunit ChlD
MVAVVVALCASRAALAAPAGADVVVLIDRAMPPEKLEVVTRSVAGMFGTFEPSVRVAVIAFAGSARVVVPLAPTTKKAADAITGITYAEGGSLAVGLRGAATALAGSKRKLKQVYVITERESVDGAKPILEKLRASGTIVSAIGYQDVNKAALSSLASTGGGDAHFVQNGAEIATVLSRTDTDVRLLADRSMAVVFVIDRSGSMSGAKLEAAKEMVRVGVEILQPTDMVAVVAFDSESQVLIRPQRAANRMRISAEISRLQAGGGTNIFPGLKDAFEILQGINAPIKHVFLISDGEAPFDGISDLVQSMSSARITVSAVGLPGADRNLLSTIAEAGNGRLYMTEDASVLPKLFVREVAESR